MLPFFSRGFIEALKIFARLAEEQKRQEAFREGGFELFALPIKKWKMYDDPRDLDELDFIVSHVSAVKGGFGVSNKRVRAWYKKLRAGQVDDALMLQIVLAGGAEKPDLDQPITNFDLFGKYQMTPEQLKAAARRIALWERYRGTVPYHQIGAANGDNVANRELRHRTWHGSLGNFGVGWALDVAAAQELEDWHIETGRASLRTLCGRILKVSAKARRDGIRIAPHRAFSPSRRGDTSANTHREIVIPVSDELDCLEIDYTIKKGRGRPVPDRWDPNALFDWNGRRLK